MKKPLRLMIYDRTCRAPGWRPGLSQAWSAGSVLYRALGRLDASRGVSSFGEALDFLANHEAGAPIAEVQFWGHGRWGRAMVDREALDEDALAPRHRLYDDLARVRDRMLPGSEGLFWFRTCETFGRAAGHSFARSLSHFMGCRVAGHTYVIGAIQSGLHSLLPGAEPGWSTREGLPPGAANPRTALWSHPDAPNTITCFHGRLPDGF